jgi:copper homeostasis protein
MVNEGKMVLEMCVDSLESAKAAQTGGAQRVELCSALAEGGLTPSLGMIGAVREALTIPVFAIMRPRGGDFSYSSEEFTVMKRDILAAKSNGADGVVIGVLRYDGTVDAERTRELVELARPMSVTFHRAFDWTPQMEEALEQIIEAGADRILTSGGLASALEASNQIGLLVRKSAGRIKIMVCGKVRPENIAEIAQKTSATEFHASLRKPTKTPVNYHARLVSLGEHDQDDLVRYLVAAEDVRAMRNALNSHVPGSSNPGEAHPEIPKL